ncbi:MAG TPA: hypothetical protein VME46_15085 [Acidimicrobiales bacterium]|nr:hypothetical protein [Acidimicrobiales bacterium]
MADAAHHQTDAAGGHAGDESSAGDERAGDERARDERDGISFSHLGEPLFDGSGASKRDLVNYLDAVAERLVPVLADRPLSVVRAHAGQEPFMQKNVPKYTPGWVATVRMWAEASKRDVSYALCNDRRTLLWFANQRAVEYHPALMRTEHPELATHLVLDLDPPGADAFAAAVEVAGLVRQALAEAGLDGAVKTSGAKGVHVFVPLAGASLGDAAAATRALAARAAALGPQIATTAFMKDQRDGKVFVDATRAAGATVIAAYSPRVRPGVPVSFPLSWSELGSVRPGELTVHTAIERLGNADPWVANMPAPQVLSPELVAEGNAIPAPRGQALQRGRKSGDQ